MMNVCRFSRLCLLFFLSLFHFYFAVLTLLVFLFPMRFTYRTLRLLRFLFLFYGFSGGRSQQRGVSDLLAFNEYTSECLRVIITYI